MEGEFRPIQRLTLNVALSHTKAEYRSSLVIPGGPATRGGDVVVAREGQEFAQPPNTADVGTRFDFQIGSTPAYARIDYAELRCKSELLDPSAEFVPRHRSSPAAILQCRGRAPLYSIASGELMSYVMQEWPRRHRITVDHYYRMAEAGLFEDDARIELIEGEIVDMPPIGSRHAGKASRLADLLRDAVAGRAIVRMQSPVRLDPRTEVQPDIAIVKLRDDYYESSHPTPADVLLLIEVSDATLRYDLEVKTPLYARHGIPELWIVDLQADTLHFRSAPVGDRYSAASSQARPGITEIASLPGFSVDLGGLFGGEPS